MALTTAQRLQEARDALHALLTGQAVVKVTDQSGESMTYSTANVSRLRAYIKELEAELAGTFVPTGPIRPMFC